MKYLSADLRHDAWPLKEIFSISRTSMSVADTVTIELHDQNDNLGRGSCVPCRRYGETVDSVTTHLEKVMRSLPFDITPDDIAALLPHSASSRNALDAALYDLKAKQTGKAIWQQLGLVKPKAIRTTDTTISLDSPEAMGAATLRALAKITHPIPQLKVKLGGNERDAAMEAARLTAVRNAAPTAELIVDSNEGWTAALAAELIPILAEQRAMLLEQPFPAHDDSALAELKFPCPVYADESAHDLSSLPRLTGKYQGICIKLDKTGGLTEALALRHAAEVAGLKTMIGCMVGSSLCIAPAILLAQGEGVIADLDGAALLAEDEAHPLKYAGGFVYPPEPALWG